MTEKTLCEMHRSVAEALGTRTALRYKRDGMWWDMSWDEVRGAADKAASAMMKLGVEKGDRVAVLSENRAEWVVTDQAILSTGAASVTMHAPLAPSQVAYQISHSQAKGVIVSGEDQAQKVFEVLDKLPDLEFLVSYEPLPDTMQPTRPLLCLTWQQLIHSVNSDEEWFESVARREAEITENDSATVIYTSGTTGNPKGVVLTHRNLRSNAESCADAGDYLATDTILSWLPYSHIYARTVDLYVTVVTHGTLCVGGPVDSLFDDLSKTSPTWMTAVPRFYEKLWAAVEHLPADLIGKQLRKILGPNMRYLSSGGAPLPTHIAEGVSASGIPLYQGYGLTETSPVITFNNKDANRSGSVGRPLPGVEVRIADDGEILTRGPHVMKEYWRNPEATAETIVDGWLATGDVGHVDDDGYLFITDRKKEIIVTSGGKNVAPSEIERILTREPIIEQAVVYGDARKFVSAIIVPNPELLAHQVEEQGWTVETEGEFITSSEIYEHFEAIVVTAMEQVSKPERVRRFLLLNRLLTLDLDELTATLKLRRRIVVDKFMDEFASLYEPDD